MDGQVDGSKAGRVAADQLWPVLVYTLHADLAKVRPQVSLDTQQDQVGQ